MKSVLGRPFVLGLLLGAVAWSSAPASSEEGVDARAAAEEAPLVAWDELCASPTTHLGRSVRVVVQTKGELAAWNPYVTRFGQREWQAWQCWSDEQEPWRKEQYEAPLVRVFARRGGPGAWALEQARPHARIVLQLRVRELFLGLPWCEVEGVVPCAEEVGEATVIHAARGIDELRLGRHELAEHSFDEALKAPLPAAARASLERLRAEAAAGPVKDN